MRSSTIVLILIIGIAAFGLGVAMNKAEVSEDISYPALLEARLLQTTSVTGEDTVSVTIKDQLAELTLVNFWATWCAPCRHEMPMFESTYTAAQDKGQDFSIIGVTIDSIENAIPFLDSIGVTYPIVYADTTGMELMAAAGNPQGLLPYSLLLDADGKVLEQKLGQVHEEDIAAWIAQYIEAEKAG